MLMRKPEQAGRPKVTPALIDNATPKIGQRETTLAVEKAGDVMRTNMTTHHTEVKVEVVAEGVVAKVKVEAKGVVIVSVPTTTTHVPQYNGTKAKANAVDSIHMVTQSTRRTPATTVP